MGLKSTVSKYNASHHITLPELESAFEHLTSGPSDNAEIEQIVFRADYGERDFRQSIEVTRAQGIIGERWTRAPWSKLDDGSPDPRIQVAILSPRLRDLVWRDRENTVHPGDTLTADLDFSEANLPAGQLLQAGTAVLRVTDLWNESCAKFKMRYGRVAYDFIRRPEYQSLRLRGLLCAVEQDGLISVGDHLQKL